MTDSVWMASLRERSRIFENEDVEEDDEDEDDNDDDEEEEEEEEEEDSSLCALFIESSSILAACLTNACRRIVLTNFLIGNSRSRRIDESC